MSEKKIVDVPSISCANCKTKIEKALTPIVEEVDVNIGTKKVTFIAEDYDLVKKTLADINYPIEEEKSEKNNDKTLLTIGIIGGLYFLIKMIVLHFLKLDVPFLEYNFIDFIVATIVQFTLGIRYYKGLLSDLKYKTFGMDFLVATSTTIAYVYSIYLMLFDSSQMLFFEIQVILLVVIFIGNTIEDIIKKKSSKDLEALLDLQVKQVLVKQDDEFILKDIEFIKENDIIKVKPGDKVPLDGIILSGSTKVNESLLTGEENLIPKNLKDEVIGGSINMDQVITLKVTKDYKNSYLNTLINQITDISDNKPQIQKVGDKIISYFVPIILILSLISFIAWYMITKDLSMSIYVALSTLIIACPCALGLATPISFMIGNSKFSQKHLLIQSIDKVMNIQKIDTIAFDKTGTLIDKNITEIKYHTKEDTSLLPTIKSIESQSNHPLAKMIVEFLGDYDTVELKDPIVENKGVGLEYDGYKIGSIKILKEEAKKDIQNPSNIFVTKNDELILEFVLDYTLRKEAKDVITQLNKKYKTIMITGDQKENALKVDKELNFSEVYSEVLPEEKINIIKDQQEKGRTIMYIGDGINDTLALAQADISIAINGDVEAVKQISDIVLISNNLNNLNDLFYIAKRVKNNVYQNYLWAFSYNVIAIPLAMMGKLNPLVAGIMMMLSSIFVISNANRLLRIK